MPHVDIEIVKMQVETQTFQATDSSKPPFSIGPDYLIKNGIPSQIQMENRKRYGYHKIRMFCHQIRVSVGQRAQRLAVGRLRVAYMHIQFAMFLRSKQ